MRPVLLFLAFSAGSLLAGPPGKGAGSHRSVANHVPRHASGPAPSGASGPAPLGASGPAPLGATGPPPLHATGPAPGIPFSRGWAQPDRRHHQLNSGFGIGFIPLYDSYVDDSPELPPPPDVEPQIGTGDMELRQQVAELTQEVRRLRAAPPAYYAPPQEPEQPVPAGPPITVILHSGQKLSISNFAVMGGVLWDFGKQPPLKIPVSSIDVAASKKASEDAGAEFPL